MWGGERGRRTGRGEWIKGAWQHGREGLVDSDVNSAAFVTAQGLAKWGINLNPSVACSSPLANHSRLRLWTLTLHRGFDIAIADPVSRSVVPTQDLIKAQGEKVWGLLQAGGYLYVCGDGAAMAKDVHAALIAVAGTHGGLSEADATAFLQVCLAALFGGGGRAGARGMAVEGEGVRVRGGARLAAQVCCDRLCVGYATGQTLSRQGCCAGLACMLTDTCVFRLAPRVCIPSHRT